MTTKLTLQERNIVSYCEQRWFLDGVLPTPETLCESFLLTPKALNTILNKDLVKQSLEERGIPTISGRGLSPQQVTAIHTMTNLADGRSYRKKLSDMGISETKWNGWRRDPEFAEYLKDITLKIFDGSLPDAHLALIENVQRGDLSSLKFFYEITGYYTGSEKQLDIRVILNRVLDIIATHVQDQETMALISRDFGLLIGLDQDARVVRGEIERT